MLHLCAHTRTCTRTHARTHTQKKVLTSEETLWQQWSDILKNWEDMYPKNAKVVKHLARRGIPEHLRGMAWQLLSLSINTELKEQYPTLIIVSRARVRARARARDRARARAGTRART